MTTIAPAPNRHVPQRTELLHMPFGAPTTCEGRTDTSTPMLLLFASYTNGQARRLDGFVAHLLQRRHNHGSLRYRVILEEERPDLFERFHVEDVPTLVVIDSNRVQRRLTGFHNPSEVDEMLAPWLH